MGDSGTASGRHWLRGRSLSPTTHYPPPTTRHPVPQSSPVPLISRMPTPELIRTRFLVVGSGIAGLHTAWRASQHGEVLLLTKRSLFDSATAYAQGGIAAALGAGDSPALHRRDTLAAGAALCDAEAVEVLVKEGPARVRELQTAGAHFDLEPGGDFKLGREAAHSRRRIVHAHGDQTGAEVARTLIKRVKETAGIKVLEKTRILELIVDDGCVLGVKAALAGK